MIELNWGVGDTLSALAVRLKQNGVVANLTGKTVRVYMEDEAGASVIAETATGVSVSDALTGEVDYQFPAEGVATRGTFYVYFYIYNANPDVDNTARRDTYQPRGIKLLVGDKGKDRTVLEDVDIRTQANNPKRIRTDEGTVEERTIDELIKADRYLKTGDAQSAAPYGLRVARSKPPGTV